MRVGIAWICMLFAPVLALAGSVDINSADAGTLARELQGIGAARAQAIVEYRERNGRFNSVDELLKVKGIGPQVIEDNRAALQVKPASK